MIRRVEKTDLTDHGKVITFECGHYLEVSEESVVEGTAPKFGREMDCVECGPEPKKETTSEPKKRGRKPGSRNKIPPLVTGETQTHTPGVIMTSPDFMREFNKIVRAQNKLDRIRKILEED